MKFIHFANKKVNSDRILFYNIECTTDLKEACIFMCFDYLPDGSSVFLKETFYNETDQGGPIGSIQAQNRMQQLHELLDTNNG